MSTDLITAALSRLKAGTSRVELVHKPYTGWPYPRPSAHSLTASAESPLPTGVSPFPGRVAVTVLDSSFNPPTLAHRALALLPSAVSPTKAHLLLLSVRNADKTPRPGDASPVRRVEMMVLLAREISAAVGLIDAPTFVQKAELLRAALPAEVQLIFVQGIDTLERFLEPRYYGDGSTQAMHVALRRFFDPDGVDSRVICARRAIGLGKSNGQSAILEAAREWLQADRVNIVDMDHGLQNLSSSEVRAKVRARDNTWREMVPNGIAEYIEEHSLYSNLT